MIEDKEIGLKIAENPIEELWTRTRDATAQRIEQVKNTLIVEEAFLELCKQKINESIKDKQ